MLPAGRALLLPSRGVVDAGTRRAGSRRPCVVTRAWVRRPSPPKPKPAAPAPAAAPKPPPAPKPAARPAAKPVPAAEPVREGKWVVDEASHRLRVDRFLRTSLGGASQKFLDRCAAARPRPAPRSAQPRFLETPTRIAVADAALPPRARRAAPCAPAR
jgi:hypothetical protein